MDSTRQFQVRLQLLDKSLLQIQVLVWWRHCLFRFKVHLGLLLSFITKLSIALFVIFYSIKFWDTSDPLMVWLRPHMRVRHLNVLRDNPNLILIEPYLLNISLARSGTIQNKTMEQIVKEQDDLRWRFNLTDDLFRWDNQSLTVAIFADRFKEQNLDLGRFKESLTVFGPSGPYDNANTSVLHVFYEWKLSLLESWLSIHPIQLHLVVMYKVDNFIWTGKISNFSNHFGKHEQIYDPFEGSSVDGVSLPDDVPHFLSQMSTDRYIHCPAERTIEWFDSNNLTIDSTKTKASVNAIVGMKGLMRDMQMQFWIACGTLLGWFRQCHITPYTDDTDFSTWMKYASSTTNLTTILQAKGLGHKLLLYGRFGDAVTSTLEYSFLSKPIHEKVDLFFVIPNGTHFQMPFHFEPYYAYSVYPQYELCSVALLGYKLLAPCTAEEVVRTEFGPNWNRPVLQSNWYYAYSSPNIEFGHYWKFKETQVEQFYDFLQQHRKD